MILYNDSHTRSFVLMCICGMYYVLGADDLLLHSTTKLIVTHHGIVFRQVLESSEEILLGYLTTILNSVLGSASQCPPVLKDFFRILVQRVRERFPDSMVRINTHTVLNFILFYMF